MCAASYQLSSPYYTLGSIATDPIARRIQRSRDKAARLHAAWEQAQAEYYREVAEAADEVGVTELSRRLGVHRQRIYQLIAKAGR